MDEQQQQAYLSLIQELLGCLGGEENDILNRHLELVDEGFVQVCEQVATQFQEAGQDDEAGFLRNVAQQVGAYLAQEEPQRNATPEEYLQFLGKVLQATSDSNGNPAVVYPLFSQNLNKLDLNLAQILTAWARDTFSQVEIEQAADIAAVIVNFANLIQQFPLGRRANNLEIAIAAYDLALEVRTREAFPEKWAMTQNNLGAAYSDRIQGERADNLEQAIAAYELALEVYTREAFPEYWAMTQNNLGTAYSDRIQGERADNLEHAIAAYHLALEVYTREAFPEQWAMTQNNLGNAYSDRIQGERVDNLEQAIAAYELALEVYTREAFPQNHVETLFNLGRAYQKQSPHDPHDPEKKQTALKNAYTTFEQALDTVEYLRGEIVSGDEAKRKLNEEWNKLYRAMVEVCLELGKYQDAIEYADRSKARNLVELIATRDAYPEGEIPQEVRQHLQQLKIAIAQEERRLHQDPNSDPTHLNHLRQEKQQLEPYKPLDFPAMQALLDEETAILEWYILGDKFLTFTLMPDAPLPTSLEGGEQEEDPSEPSFSRGAGGITLWTSSQEDLKQLIDWGNAYLRDYRNRDNSQWRETLAQRLEQLSKILHLDEILQNLRKNFPNCQKLILIPHRFLHLFPLHALPIAPFSALGRGSGGEGSESKFLQDLFPKGVTYAPNCQLLQQAQNRQRPHFNQLLAIQNPTEDLDWADVEIENIRTLFPNRNNLARDKATTAKLLNEQYQKILSQTHHLFFSCHAAFNPNSPLDSGLLLADGILTLETIIANLNLNNCSLVTLSACETGQVALDQTDEYISLSSGFILAGSPSVLVSLWSVNQVSTALLLIRTYELLQQQPGKLAQSLQAAQKWLRETTVSGFELWRQQCPLFSDEWRAALQPVFAQMGKNKEEGINHRPYQSPYHWAAFCIVGEGEQTMASDAKKIAAFAAILQENLNNWIVNHGESLLALQQQLGDDDEKNAQAIEVWLQQRQDLYDQYTAKLAPPKRTLSLGGEKGGFGTQPTGGDKSLAKLIEQAVKTPTNLKTSAPSPEQDREKPQS